MIVVARAILDRPGGSSNPVLASSGTDTGMLFEADTGRTGFYGRLTLCADAGMRTVAHVTSAAHQFGGAPFAMDGINGGAIGTGGVTGAGGQIAVGGGRMPRPAIRAAPTFWPC